MKKHYFHTHTIKYRPDIDGLRAIAVLAVVIFHAFPKKLPGGFVGVDVFFVISGYLITSIILNDFSKDQFSIATFYTKRIKRIFPSLILVLMTSLIVGYITLLPSELKELGKHITGSTLFISNIILWREIGYFDILSELKPLLHLWSLAIEEQYYIVWPIIVFFFWNKKYFTAITFILLVISFSINLYMLGNSPSGAFYSPLSRFWEIITGASLAILHYKNIRFMKFHTFKSFVGLFLIGYSVFTFNAKTIFPGWMALIPVIGTFLVIDATNLSKINSKLLSNKYLVFIGLISYPLYLWHWPIFVFSRILNEGPVSNKIHFCLIIISITLGVLTYLFLEKPLKSRDRNFLLKNITIILCLTLSIIGLSGLLIYKKKGLPDRSFLLKNNVIVGWTTDLPNTNNCLDKFTKLEDSFCSTSSNPPLVAIIGDSHAGAIFTGFINSKNESLRNAIVLGRGSCQPTMGFIDKAGCNDQLLSALNIINSDKKIKTVFLHSYFKVLMEKDQKAIDYLSKGYSETLDILLKNKKHVVVILDTPTLNFEPSSCVERRHIYLSNFILRKECATSANYHKKQRIHYYEFMRKLSVKYPQVTFYDPAHTFYRNNKYWGILDSQILYTDYNHLSPIGAKMVVDDFVDFYKKKGNKI